MKTLEPSHDEFYTQTDYETFRGDRLKGPDGWLLFVATDSGLPRAQRIVDLYNKKLEKSTDYGKQVLLVHKQDKDVPIVKKFDDEETNPRLPIHVAGANVFLFSDPHNKNCKTAVNDEIYRTMQLAYTLKTCGVCMLNVIMPYLPYSRAERASYLQRESAQAKLFLDLMKTSGVDRILSYHLHNDAIRSFFQPKRMIGISGLNLFKEIFGSIVENPEEIIVVSTDAGGAKSNHHLAKSLKVAEAICNKVRSTTEERTEALGIIGNFNGRRIALFSDDESVSFGSFLNAIKGVAGKVDEMYAAVSHNKLVEKYMYRLDEAKELGLKKLFVTDSVPQDEKLLQHELIEVKSLDSLITFVINRMHYNISIGTLFH